MFRTFLLLIVIALHCGCTSQVYADESQWLIQDPQPIANQQRTGSGPSLRKMGGGLAVVLGGFFLVTVLMRKQVTAPPAGQLMQSLGSVQIAPKVRLHLVRLGSRILVLHINGQNVQRVAELTDPEEVQKFLNTNQQETNSLAPVSVRHLIDTLDTEELQRSVR